MSPGSGADKAGIKVDDIITALEGKPITSSDQVGAAIRAHKLGESISVTVNRGGKSITLTVTLGVVSA